MKFLRINENSDEESIEDVENCPITPSRRILIENDPLHPSMRSGTPYSITTIDSYLNLVAGGQPEADVLSALESFTLASGTRRQKRDIASKLMKEHVVFPILIDRNELRKTERLTRSDLFRTGAEDGIHIATGSISNILYQKKPKRNTKFLKYNFIF